MRKIVVGACVAMDGVMQAPGGPQEDVAWVGRSTGAGLAEASTRWFGPPRPPVARPSFQT
jgi:hypothetical protein